MRFLIVDNIKPSQEILKQFALRYTSKQVDSTHYAQDVASICQERVYDVILLGYDLGENQKNGQQILEELRVNKYISRQCIVILITAEVSQSMVLAAIEHKPDHYLCKPYSLNELNKRLSSCLNKKVAMSSIYKALDQDNAELVIEQCQNAVKLDSPYSKECQGIMSRQYLDLGQYDKAKEIYLAHENIKNCQWAKIGLGKIALHENKYKSAEKLFKQLIKQFPLYLSSYDWLATTYEGQFHYLFAEEILEQALKLSPRSLTRLQKYASLCIHNEHFDKAVTAYENNYKFAHNSIHHCADNTVKYVLALIEHNPSLSLKEAKEANNKAFKFMKKMIRDFNDTDVKIKSHFLGACLYEITKEEDLARELNLKAELLLAKEQDNISEEKLLNISDMLKKLNRSNLVKQVIPVKNSQVDLISEDEAQQNHDTKLLEVQAQIDIESALSLFSKSQFLEAIAKLRNALELYPNNRAIKINLVQMLLVAYEKGENIQLDEAANLLGGLLKLKLSKKELFRIKKMQKKYQQLAGI